MAFFIRERTFAVGAKNFDGVNPVLREIGAWCVSECPFFASYKVEERPDGGGLNLVMTSASGKSTMMIMVYNSYGNIATGGTALVGGARKTPSMYGASFIVENTRVSLAWTDYGYVSISVSQGSFNTSGSVFEVPISATDTIILIGAPYSGSGTAPAGCFSFPCKTYNEAEDKFYDITVLPPTSTVKTFATWIKSSNAGIARAVLCTADPSVDGFIPGDFEIYRASLATDNYIESAARYITTSEGDFLCTALNNKPSGGTDSDARNILLK